MLEEFSVKGKRDSLRIICEILKLLNSGPATITRIVYGTNLNHESAQRYLSLLERRGFVLRILSGEGRLFAITEKGEQVLRDFRKAVDNVWSPIEGIA